MAYNNDSDMLQQEAQEHSCVRVRELWKMPLFSVYWAADNIH